MPNTTGTTQQYIYGLCWNAFYELLPISNAEYCVGSTNIVMLTGTNISANVNNAQNGVIHVSKNANNRLEFRIYIHPIYGGAIAQGVPNNGYACVGGTWISWCLSKVFVFFSYSVV